MYTNYCRTRHFLKYDVARIILKVVITAVFQHGHQLTSPCPRWLAKTDSSSTIYERRKDALVIARSLIYMTLLPRNWREVGALSSTTAARLQYYDDTTSQ